MVRVHVADEDRVEVGEVDDLAQVVQRARAHVQQQVGALVGEQVGGADALGRGVGAGAADHGQPCGHRRPWRVGCQRARRDGGRLMAGSLGEVP